MGPFRRRLSSTRGRFCIPSTNRREGGRREGVPKPEKEGEQKKRRRRGGREGPSEGNRETASFFPQCGFLSTGRGFLEAECGQKEEDGLWSEAPAAREREKNKQFAKSDSGKPFKSQQFRDSFRKKALRLVCLQNIAVIPPKKKLRAEMRPSRSERSDRPTKHEFFIPLRAAHTRCAKRRQSSSGDHHHPCKPNVFPVRECITFWVSSLRRRTYFSAPLGLTSLPPSTRSICSSLGGRGRSPPFPFPPLRRDIHR